jgi:hypothetical protein
MEEGTSPVVTREEAYAWKDRVAQAAHNSRELLWEGYQRAIWHRLGYPTWTACVHGIAQELELSERHLWHLHGANVWENQLNPGSVGQIPERQLRPLRRLKPEERPQTWQKVQETAPNGHITAAHVQTVVDMLHPPKPKPEIILPSHGDRETARSALFRAMDLLPGSLEWALLTQVWHWLRDAEPDHLRLQQELARIKEWYMSDVDLEAAGEKTNIMEATIEGESQALVPRRQS